MADISQIAKQFVDFYYQQFDSNRTALQSLYRDHSMLTWEDKQIMGTQRIQEHLQNLPFQKVQHKVTTQDAQPSSQSQASMIVLVTGQLIVDDGPMAMNYSQCFHLIPDAGTYYVLNDVFRLNYG